jgi:hypothetical protein
MVSINHVRNIENKKKDNNVIKLQQINGSYTIMNFEDFNLGDL